MAKEKKLTQKRSAISSSADSKEIAPPTPRLGGALFWLTAGIALTKDLIIDPTVALLVAAGLGLTATVLGAVIGIPIAIFAWGMGFLFTVTIWITMQAYFLTHGGLHRSAKIKRFVAWFFAIFIGMIPGLSILPETTILFFFIAWLENAIRKHAIAEYALNIVEIRKKNVEN